MAIHMPAIDQIEQLGRKDDALQDTCKNFFRLLGGMKIHKNDLESSPKTRGAVPQQLIQQGCNFVGVQVIQAPAIGEVCALRGFDIT
jgi:hypothetical protein